MLRTGGRKKMLKSEQKRIIESAAEELSCLIGELNKSIDDDDDIGKYNYQTCYELMVLAKEL